MKDSLGKIESSANFRISYLTLKHIIELEKETNIPEMHDRIIVIDTKINNASLITKDRPITNWTDDWIHIGPLSSEDGTTKNK